MTWESIYIKEPFEWWYGFHDWTKWLQSCSISFCFSDSKKQYAKATSSQMLIGGYSLWGSMMYTAKEHQELHWHSALRLQWPWKFKLAAACPWSRVRMAVGQRQEDASHLATETCIRNWKIMCFNLGFGCYLDQTKPQDTLNRFLTVFVLGDPTDDCSASKSASCASSSCWLMVPLSWRCCRKKYTPKTKPLQPDIKQFHPLSKTYIIIENKGPEVLKCHLATPLMHPARCATIHVATHW